MPPTMVGVFEQGGQGRGAFEELQRQGFSVGELGLVESDGDLVDQVSTLATADVAGHGLSDVLVGMGVPRAPANEYARHLAAHETIVTVAVLAGARARTAARVLRRCGARDLSRF